MMKLAVRLVLGILIISSRALSRQYDHCGERTVRNHGLMINAKISQRGMWPWQVGIYKQGAGPGWGFLCGGSLISPQWVLTAAHCFYVEKKTSERIWFEPEIGPANKYKIRAGDHLLNSYESSEQERPFQEIVLHPDYKHHPNYDNDIALVKLNSIVNVGPFVRTVCLPDPAGEDLAKPGTSGSVAGWGATEYNSLSSFLRYSFFKVNQDDACRKDVKLVYYNHTVFCASDVKGPSAPCYGDSGGSMVRKVLRNGKYRYVAFGLVSWGGCSLGSHFGYYTRLQPFLPWILHKINSTCLSPGLLQQGTFAPVKSIYQAGEVVTFTCNTNYTRFGATELTCQQDGTWNGKKPFCLNLASCSQPAKPRNGFLIGRGFAHGRSVMFLCRPRYKRIGPSIIFCADGKWNKLSPTCAAPCPDPGTPINGERHNHSFLHDDQVTFSCDDGIHLVGKKIITCNDGRWDQPAPSCSSACSILGHPINGQRLDDNFYNGSTVRFGCRYGFSRRGPESVTCINGKWSDRSPVCKECGSPVGMEKNIIPDKNIRASIWKRGREARNGRLNGPLAWCSGHLIIYDRPYLEVELDFPHKITYIAAQGSQLDNKWVAKYIIGHTLAKSSFVEYREKNREKVFTGNTDATSVVKHKLKNPFIARKVRFYPSGRWIVGNRFNRACMRVEIYGCSLPTNCVMVGSRVLGRWGIAYNGAELYYKSYVKSIDHKFDEVRVVLEDKRQRSDKYKLLSKNYVVLDIPNKQLELPINTRVLAPWNNRYHTGYIQYKNKIRYGVRADDNDFQWFRKDQIRVLKLAQFCKG